MYVHERYNVTRIRSLFEENAKIQYFYQEMGNDVHVHYQNLFSISILLF